MIESNSGYDEKCDLWSCGVILYILLSGRPPFLGANDFETLRKVKKGVFNYPEQIWNRFTPEVKDLINLMLVVDPKKRISAEEAFAH